MGKGDLELYYIDAIGAERKERGNEAEKTAIFEYLAKESPDPRSIAILTPYAD